MTTNQQPTKQKLFSPYQRFIIAILTILQFSIVLDFMVLSPLGAFLIRDWHIRPSQFGLVVSVYAWSAGISGLVSAGFADKFDRKKFLLFFYAGFLTGTVLCAFAPNYPFLLFARIVTGIFGGVIGSVSFAIISDLFKWEVRGRVMGFVQMAFAASQVLGLPIGLLLADRFGWHSPFWMIAGVGVIVGMVIIVYMKPVKEHLKIRSDQRNPFHHLIKTISQPQYVRAFMAMTLLATGGFMLMPLGSTFSNLNLGIELSQLWILYGFTGGFTIIFGPLIGKLSDKIGKYKIFVIGSFISSVVVLIYTNLGITPLWIIIILSVLLFIGITSRMITSSALMTAVPEPQDRGAFMSINASIQQIAGGIASWVAGLIVVQSNGGPLQHYNWLGYVVITTMLITVVMMYFLNSYVKNKISKPFTASVVEERSLVAE
ncbi:MAG TPA: MFS transporter [Chitinophagaceae bacterium]|jgi:predicted MFS family arabinose efflux permease|nr:MFS transporter [Chitinophagaceae bacterium]